MCARLLASRLDEHRQFDVVLFGDLCQRAQIFWQAGAAEREAGLQIRRRNVQACVGAHQPHHFVRSMPSACDTRPISLAKVILRA